MGTSKLDSAFPVARRRATEKRCSCSATTPNGRTTPRSDPHGSSWVDRLRSGVSNKRKCLATITQASVYYNPGRRYSINGTPQNSLYRVNWGNSYRRVLIAVLPTGYDYDKTNNSFTGPTTTGSTLEVPSPRIRPWS